MVEKLLVLPSAACAGGGSAAGAFAQPPDLVLLPGWPCRRAAQAGSQLLFYLLELPRCSSARGLRSLFTRLPASALRLQARLSGRRHPAPGAEEAADGGQRSLGTALHPSRPLPLPRLFSSLRFSPEPLHLYPEWLESSSSSKAAGHSF